MPPNVKICTFSLAPTVITKLEALQKSMHIPNKSRILTLLIEREYTARVGAGEGKDIMKVTTKGL